MYFDAVLDRNYKVLFNGTPAETKQWLNQNTTDINDLVVADGREARFKTVGEYLDSGS